MEYRVEQLAAAAGLRVDTLRFYQSRGLISPPERVGRVAVYSDEHLEGLRRIRRLRRQGFKLDQIGRVLEGTPSDRDALLDALVQERVGARSFTRDELAAEAGVPEPLVRAVEASGLVEPLMVDGEARFSEADLQMARAGLQMLESGFPLHELLGVAAGHARHVQELCDRAINLFDDHVRKQAGEASDSESVTAAFRTLLPQVTRLVALHFQRTLVSRALGRLQQGPDREALAAARAATDSARLDVEVAWR